MLKLSKHSYLSLPHLDISLPHQMHLAPVVDDDDELSRAILQDPADHDDNWELSERPDNGELETYWAHVEEDIQNDPEWVVLTDK